MTKEELFQCHAILAAIKFTYNPATTDSPTLRIIQLCTVLGVAYPKLCTHYSLQRFLSLPRIILKINDSSIIYYGIHHINWCHDLDRWLLCLSEEQYEFVIRRINFPVEYWEAWCQLGKDPEDWSRHDR